MTPANQYGKWVRRLKRDAALLDKVLELRGVAIDTESSGAVALDGIFERIQHRRKLLDSDFADLQKLRKACHAMVRIRETVHQIIELLEEEHR